MANVIYNEYKRKVGTIDWADDNLTFKIMLVESGYTVDIDNHKVKNDISNEVPDGDGYTIGGTNIVNRVVNIDIDNNFAKFDADNITWNNSTITARGAVIYLDTGDGSTSTLIAYIDFGESKASVSGDFIIQWSVNGIYQLG